MACRSEIHAKTSSWHISLSDASPQGLETLNAGGPQGVRLFLFLYLCTDNTLLIRIKGNVFPDYFLRFQDKTVNFIP
jgi:hypothetical protein